MMRQVLRLTAIAALLPLITSCSVAKSTLPSYAPAQTHETAATALTPNATVPRHVLTGAYLFSNDNLTSHERPFSAYSSSLSWAETYAGTNVSRAGIKTILYTNPNRQPPPPTGKIYPTQESAFAHTCSGARIYEQRGTTKYYLTNPFSSVMINVYKNYVANQLAQQHFDLIFDDEPFDWLALSAMPCNYSATPWLNAYKTEIAAVGHPMLYNGLGNLGPNGSISPTIALNSATVAAMAENCYGSKFGAPLKYGTYWTGIENTEIAMAQQHKLFMCYSSNLSTASTAIAARLYVYASFLLTYDLGTSLIWEYFQTASWYTVEPESQLVALSPAVATPSTISGLRQSTGVYARKYGACYLAGRLVGACAVVVNSDNVSSHRFPFTGYHHTLALHGGGILDGGTVATNGAAPPSNLAPISAVIAFP